MSGTADIVRPRPLPERRTAPRDPVRWIPIRRGFSPVIEGAHKSPLRHRTTSAGTWSWQRRYRLPRQEQSVLKRKYLQSSSWQVVLAGRKTEQAGCASLPRTFRPYPISMLPLYVEFVDSVWIPDHSEPYLATRDPAVSSQALACHARTPSLRQRPIKSKKTRPNRRVFLPKRNGPRSGGELVLAPTHPLTR
jgi:hypothetical protein